MLTWDSFHASAHCRTDDTQAGTQALLHTPHNTRCSVSPMQLGSRRPRRRVCVVTTVPVAAAAIAGIAIAAASTPAPHTLCGMGKYHTVQQLLVALPLLAGCSGDVCGQGRRVAAWRRRGVWW